MGELYLSNLCSFITIKMSKKSFGYFHICSDVLIFCDFIICIFGEYIPKLHAKSEIYNKHTQSCTATQTKQPTITLGCYKLQPCPNLNTTRLPHPLRQRSQSKLFYLLTNVHNTYPPYCISKFVILCKSLPFLNTLLCIYIVGGTHLLNEDKANL